MAEDVRLFKLVTGEVVMGKFDEKNNTISDVANIQSVPLKQGGVQILILPYGYPFENNFGASIDGKHILFIYSNTPEELQAKYLETIVNVTNSGGMNKMQFGQIPTPEQSNIIK